MLGAGDIPITVLLLSVLATAGKPNTHAEDAIIQAVRSMEEQRRGGSCFWDAGVPLWKMLSSTILIPLIPLQRRAHMAARCSQLSAPHASAAEGCLAQGLPTPSCWPPGPIDRLWYWEDLPRPKAGGLWATLATERPRYSLQRPSWGLQGSLPPPPAPLCSLALTPSPRGPPH